ncbi:hypothetical protein KQ878_01660 [Mycoplasma zalophidermidis]|uniref:DUF31 domain-containing protein n=1 Tax=Mycoplasma zalophidermidis TaxID=398174 RepID=A0ABS6DRG5_9MOLU|nr:hypothetical protein [Mycoplasma zalophidermidis]MBU4693587.1 hypothetical protein [Mycoplasma zalophidermidis]
MKIKKLLRPVLTITTFPALISGIVVSCEKNNSKISDLENTDINLNDEKSQDKKPRKDVTVSDINTENTQIKEKKIDQKPKQNNSLSPTDNAKLTFDYKPIHDISPNWNFVSETNVLDKNEFDENDSIFDLYKTFLNNKELTTDITFNNSDYQKFNFFKARYDSGQLIVLIKSNFAIDKNKPLSLLYSDNGKENKIKLTRVENTNNLLIANLSNVNTNYKIKLLRVVNNLDQEVDFDSKNKYLIAKEIWNKSNNFTVKNENKWRTWPSNGNNHSLAVKVIQKSPQFELPMKARIILLTKNNELEYHDMQIDNKKRNRDGLYEEILNLYFNVTNVKEILGLEVCERSNPNEWRFLGGVSNKIVIEGQNELSDSEMLPEINFVEKSNNFLKINFNGDISKYKNVKFEIKSTNPFVKYSNIFSGNTNDNQVSIDISSLPKNIEEFVITRFNLDKGLITLPFESKYTFKKYTEINKEYQITKFNLYKDSDNNKLFGSIAFNFDTYDYDRFNNKSIELVFKRKQQDFENSRINGYWNLFLKEQKIIIPFKKWSKFNLNGFYENELYTLNSVRIVENLTLVEVVPANNFKNSVSQLKNKEFSYKFDYKDANDDYLFGYKDGETKNSLLLKDKNDLPKDFQYSLQNHYAKINYERENWYKSKIISNTDTVISNKLRNDKINLVLNGKNVRTHMISPREQIYDLKWDFNKYFTKASITKNLLPFKNLNYHLDDAIITLGFEFDPKQRELTDLVEMEPFVQYTSTGSFNLWSVRNVSKSFVYISIPYKQIVEHKKLNNLNFEYLAVRHSKKQEHDLKNLIASRYIFEAELKNENEITFTIKSLFDDTKIFERLGDHYLSLNNSAFLGNSSLFIYYSDVFSDKTIDYKPVGNKNIKTIGLEQLNFKDNYVNLDTKLDGSSIRLYSEDQEPNVINARQRTFNFDKEKAAEGTWAIIGKVNPNDPTDFRYYVSTNQHVWGRLGFIPKSKVFDNPRFDTPKPIKSPVGGWSIDKHDPRERFYPGIEWNDVRVKVDLINSFDNDNVFPNSAIDFKNNYGDINTDDKWETYSEHTSNSLSRADMVVGIADFKDIFNVFEEKNGIIFYKNKPINQPANDKEKSIKRVYDFFMSIKNIKTLKPSIHNLHLSEFTNLGWTIASFPVEAQNASGDTNSGKRYREYLIGNLNKPIGRLGYGGVSTSLPSLRIDTRLFDLNGGSSGTMIFDSEGNATSLYTETSQTYGGAMVIDTQAGAFLGDGKTTQNPGSFYERMRLLCYLYPDLYESNEFNELPNWINI